MFLNNDLDIIYNNLSDIKCNMFCNNNDYLREHHLIKNILCDFFDKNICIPMKQEHDDCECFDLINLLICTISNIEKYTYYNKQHGYLLQIQRLKCLLENIEKLLFQIKCFPTKDCDLLSKVLCLLFEIIELLANIILKIKNLECLCKSHFCCKCEIFECLLRVLIEEIDDLEDRVSDFAQIVLKIASLNIINCTASTVSPRHIAKDRSYMTGCCDCSCDCDFCNKKPMNPYI